MDQHILNEITMLEVMDAVRDGIVIIDKNAKIIYVNEAYTRILKVTREKVLYKQMNVIEPEAMILDVLKDKRPRVRQMVQVKSRGQKIQVTIRPILRNGKIIGAISIFTDITELSLSQQELKKAQQLNHSIFKAAGQHEKALPDSFSHIIGKDERFIRCLRLAAIVSTTDATVLIQGESGTGKEVLMDAMLKNSLLKDKPYVSLNCSAIPESLIESELFGYAPGSFTGASKNGKVGKFEQANGGTIFLDEIGDMPLFMQAKLLRVLQSGEIQKIGADMVQKVRVRVIAATNRNLKDMVEKGTFREDLYFRLNTFTIALPPLRERGKDVMLLAQFFLNRYATKYGKKISISPEVERAFLAYSWHGNIRQLQSCMEYAAIVCNGSYIELAHLPEDIQRGGSQEIVDRISRAEKQESTLKSDIQRIEREQIEKALEETRGNKTKAMQRLGISRRTFYKKLKLYGLDENIYKK